MGELARTVNLLRGDVAALRRDVVIRETYIEDRARMRADIAELELGVRELARQREDDQAETGRRRWQVVLALLTGSISLAVAAAEALLSLGGH